MTREEALAELSVLHERLSNPKDCEDGCYSWEDGWYVEAVDMAIEALTYQNLSKPNNTCEVDLISRADAIEAVRYLIYDRQEKGAKPFKWWFIKQRLNAIPSADAEQGVGRYEKAMQKLREMPSYINGVKAKQIKKIPSDAVHGEWKRLIEYVPESNESLIEFDGYQCSVCGGKLLADGFNFWNYCPNCGAIMKGGDDE